jgi:hypothetical protein
MEDNAFTCKNVNLCIVLNFNVKTIKITKKMTSKEYYQKALVCAASPDPDVRYLSIKYLRQAIANPTHESYLSDNTILFLVAIAKTLNNEPLNEGDIDILKKVNYGHYRGSIKDHIAEIWVKSIKFDLLMNELQTMQQKLDCGKEQMEMMESIIGIASKYLLEGAKTE